MENITKRLDKVDTFQSKEVSSVKGHIHMQAPTAGNLGNVEKLNHILQDQSILIQLKNTCVIFMRFIKIIKKDVRHWIKFCNKCASNSGPFILNVVDPKLQEYISLSNQI